MVAEPAPDRLMLPVKNTFIHFSEDEEFPPAPAAAAPASASRRRALRRVRTDPSPPPPAARSIAASPAPVPTLLEVKSRPSVIDSEISTASSTASPSSPLPTWRRQGEGSSANETSDADVADIPRFAWRWEEAGTPPPLDELVDMGAAPPPRWAASTPPPSARSPAEWTPAPVQEQASLWDARVWGQRPSTPGAAAWPMVPSPPFVTPPAVDPGFFFRFTIRRADGVGLGLELLRWGGGRALIVQAVLEGGAIEAWNRQFPDGLESERAVRPGDVLVSVNDQVECQRMLEECRSKFLLRLGIARLPGAAGDAPMLALALPFDVGGVAEHLAGMADVAILKKRPFPQAAG